MRCFWLFIAGFILLTNTSVHAKCEPGETLIKFSHVVPTDKHPKGIVITLLAKRINEEMNGIACMEVYPNSTLYSDDKVLEAMLNGDVQMAAPSLSKFDKYTKKLRIFDLFFLFKDLQTANAFQQSEAGQRLKDSMLKRGLKGLIFLQSGMKQISANRPLLLPQDAKGLKFRVQPSDVLVAQFQALGANPQKMTYSEVYSSLQTGVIDGQENSWSNIYAKKFFEIQNGITETNHAVLGYLLVTSVKWWDSLTPAVRAQIEKILSDIKTVNNRTTNQIEMANRQKIIDAKGIVRTLTPQQKQMWINTFKPVWQKFEKDVGADNLAAAKKLNH